MRENRNVDKDLLARFGDPHAWRWVRRLPMALGIFLVGFLCFFHLNIFSKPDVIRGKRINYAQLYETTNEDGSVTYKTGRFVRVFPHIAGQEIDPRPWADAMTVDVYDLTTGKKIRPRLMVNHNSVKIAGLPKARLSIDLNWDTNPDNPPLYPGDFRMASIYVDLDTAWMGTDEPIMRIMGLQEPMSNETELPFAGLAACRDTYSAENTMRFSWEDMGEDVNYRWAVSSIRCGSGRSDKQVQIGEGSATHAVVNLPRSRPGEKYGFFLTAWKNGFPYGQLYTHEEDWVGHHFLFRVNSGPLGSRHTSSVFSAVAAE